MAKYLRRTGFPYVDGLFVDGLKSTTFRNTKLVPPTHTAAAAVARRPSVSCTMARLTEAAPPPVETLEVGEKLSAPCRTAQLLTPSVKRRFIRQNRDLAKYVALEQSRPYILTYSLAEATPP